MISGTFNKLSKTESDIKFGSEMTELRLARSFSYYILLDLGSNVLFVAGCLFLLF